MPWLAERYGNRLKEAVLDEIAGTAPPAADPAPVVAKADEAASRLVAATRARGRRTSVMARLRGEWTASDCLRPLAKTAGKQGV
jgi:hypothetical protein